MEIVCAGGSATAVPPVPPVPPVPGTPVALSAPLEHLHHPEVDEVAVREGRALGAAGGAAGKEDDRRGVLGDDRRRGDLPPVDLGLGHQAVNQPYRHLRRYRVLIEPGQSPFVPGDQDRAGQLDAGLQLRSCPPSVEAGDDRPQGHGRPHQQGVLGRVGRHDRYPVARPDPVPLGQQDRQRIDVRQRLAERPGLIGRGQEDKVTVVGAMSVQRLAQCLRPPGEDRMRVPEYQLGCQLERGAGSEQGLTGRRRHYLRPHPAEVRGRSVVGFCHGLASCSVPPVIVNSGELDPSFC